MRSAALMVEWRAGGKVVRMAGMTVALTVDQMVAASVRH